MTYDPESKLIFQF